MDEVPCQYGKSIGKPTSWQTDANGLKVCVFCHAKSHTPTDERPPVKTLRK